MISRRNNENLIVRVEKYLNQKYEFRLNVINHKIESMRKGSQNWKELNENNIFIDLRRRGDNISMATLISLLKSDFVPTYNPFEEYFKNLSMWDGSDHINALANFIKLDDRERFDRHFKKMLVRTVACALNVNVFNKQAFILVQEKQNSGKSTFCRFLVPSHLSDYFAENIGTDKDSRIALCENFIINLDELAKLNKSDINELKSLFSSQSEKLRRPYDRRAERLTRRASFFGSTNSQEFLTDETGSVRWLCFNIREVDWKYKQRVDIDQVWSQAYELYKDRHFDYQLTKEEVAENDRENAVYNVITSEMELIQLYFKPGSKAEYDVFLTATEVIKYLQEKIGRAVSLSPVLVGKAFKLLGFERVQRFNGSFQIKGYYLSYLLSDSHE